MSEIGLRYRPVATADQEDHQTCCLLLARDLTGTDPGKLADAANEWARNERWMPKAADLLAIVARSKPTIDPDGPDNLHRLAAKYNANPETCRPGQRWIVVGKELRIEHA